MPLHYEVSQRVLPNGLRVIVNEDHTVPVVAVNLWVGVGSRHEEPGRTGLAHLFEHLMFQGSENVASGEHFATLLGLGARLNATTSFDRTNYFETVPSGALDLTLWLEADRHARLLPAVTQENLDNQRDVVVEEKRQRYENVPYGHAFARLFELVFPEEHPYHHPTIGSMDDLQAASLQDVHAFFERYYGPANTVLTLCGDITPEQGFAAVERYFGGLPAGAPSAQDSARRGPVLRPLEEPRRLELREDVPADRLYVAFRAPVDDTEEHLAVGCALDALGSLTISRLEKTLVRGEELCVSASAGLIGLVDGASLGLIVLEASEGVDPARIEQRLCEELERFATEGPTPGEMEASIAQTERSWLSSLASLEERADHIGHRAMLFDDPEGINTYVDRLAALTPEQVRQAAATWLRPENRAVLTYIADGVPAREGDDADDVGDAVTADVGDHPASDQNAAVTMGEESR